MSRYDRIVAIAEEHLKPDLLEVIDESGQHNVPAGAESHFRIRCVSSRFEGLSAVRRHQLVYGLLASELATGLHALSLELSSPTESPTDKKQSPPCLGG